MNDPAATTATGAPMSADIKRVSTFELFFDLVFVFTLTQLTGLVTHPHDVSDYFKTMLVFMTLMWIYGGFAWLTSNLRIESIRQKYWLFAAMSGFFVMALSIPTVFGAGGITYGIGLVLVTAIHARLFTTAPTGGARAIAGIAPYNFSMAALVLASGFVDPPWDWPLWIAALVVVIAATLRRTERNFGISPSHFVERNGLLIMVALGESVVDMGVGASGLPIDGTLVVSVVLALFLAGTIWRTYFDKDDTIAEERLRETPPEEQGRMALIGFGYAHFAMIFGILITAAGLKVAIAQPLGHTDPIGIVNLAVGLALYLVGDAWYRHTLHIGPNQVRLLIAALIAATIPLGLLFGALAQLVACVLLYQLIWPLEGLRRGGRLTTDD